MSTAFASIEGYDVIYDQMCYSPLDAAISAKVFKGRVKRYVMASTIEVYRHLYGQLRTPFVEGDVDLSREAIDMSHPWHAPELAEENYSKGKRQAEAFFHQDGTLPVVSVRIGHVLAGPEDFTGRLASYVTRVREGKPLRHSQGRGQSSFISAASISNFMCWAGDGAFLGLINAANDGHLSAVDIHLRVAHVLNRHSVLEPVSSPVEPSELSPFDYPMPYVLDTGKAQSLGFHFGHSDQWLDALIRQHALALGE